ncbi:MAG: DNA -binding domain-containing protein [Alphaproteobacteria bacterium]
MQWAWEFLRRNTEYRKGWRRSVEPWLLKKRISHHEDFVATFDSAGHEKFVALGLAEPWDSFARRFGIEFPIDPRSSSFYGFLRHGSSYVKKDKWDAGPIVIDLAATEVAVFFDFDEPIEPQLARARAILDQQARELGQTRKTDPSHLTKPRPQVNRFSRYLRLLDAYDAGVSRAQMAAVFFPRKVNPAKHVENNLKAAENLSRLGYRTLSLWDEPRTARITKC